MQAPTFKGTVYVVGVVSGGPKLLNGEAAHLLRTAEVVLHDDAVSAEILDLIPASTQVRNVRKLCAETEHLQEKIDSLLIAAAREGHQVVRLIVAEPSELMLAGQEAEGLVEAGIKVEYIPCAPIAVGAVAGANSH